MRHTQTLDWFHSFKNGCTSVACNKCSVYLSLNTNNEVITRVRDLVRIDQIQAIREEDKELGISFGSCHANLTKYFGMRHVSEVNPMAAVSRAAALPMFNL
jgi:hypothetical protein